MRARMPDIMEKKRKFEEDIESIDKKLIMVSPTPRGHYTLLDGNKRSVALRARARQLLFFLQC